MKKIIALSIVVIPYFTFAQFTKAQVYLGGTLSTSFQNSTSNVTPPNPNLSKNNSLSISPTIGFFLNPKISLGGSIGYSSALQQFDYSTYDPNVGAVVRASRKYKTSGFAISGFARHFIPISNSFYFALQEQISFTRSNAETTQVTGTTETSNQSPNYSIGFAIRPILIFFPSPKWGIEAGVGTLGYSYTRYLADVASSNTFSLNAGSFSFGLAYYFAKK
jgi:hypothetical protein